MKLYNVFIFIIFLSAFVSSSPNKKDKKHKNQKKLNKKHRKHKDQKKSSKYHKIYCNSESIALFLSSLSPKEIHFCGRKS